MCVPESGLFYLPVSRSGQFHAAEIFLRPDNSHLGQHIHFGWFSGVLVGDFP